MSNPKLTSPLKEAVDILEKSDEISQRLRRWCEKLEQTVSGEPLTDLLCGEIKALATKTHEFRIIATHYAVLEDRGAATLADAAKLAQHLANVKLCLFDVLELQDFYKHAERCGHDGALNSRFALSYILRSSGACTRGRAYANEDKLLRIGLRWRDFICALDPEVAGESPPDFVDVFQRLEPKITDLVTWTAEQFQPRHVYSYKALSDTPYSIDSGGEIFSGGFGTVQKVSHRRTGEPLAMKRFRNVFKEKERKKVLREIGVLEVCSHKNIVELVEAFQLDDDEIRVVMSPWAPFTLAMFLRMSDIKRKKRCPWFDTGSADSDHCVYRIMYEITDAIDYLHGRSIKHKDLKPDNILLRHESTHHITPVITDVGASKVYIPGAGTNYKDSTYEYLAPEQHNMEASTLRSDIWQLGCCFAELLSVAVGGTVTHEKLLDSYIRDESACSCCIAEEHGPFTDALAQICLAGKGSSAMRRAYGIVVGMLDLNPAGRLDIGQVKAQVSMLPGV